MTNAYWPNTRTSYVSASGAFLISKAGEIRSEAEWRNDVDRFWCGMDAANSYLNPARQFKRPEDAFERYARIVGLQPHKGEQE